MPDNETIEERARDFILSRTRYATEYAAEMYGKDFAEFATIEREKAVREAFQMIQGQRGEGQFTGDSTLTSVMRGVLKKMFGK
jgi:hypothetical protein